LQEEIPNNKLTINQTIVIFITSKNEAIEI